MPPLKRYPRIERDETIEVQEDENSHMWAVSYADFLMALLSFFILFFSIDEKSQNQLFMQLTKEFSDVAEKKAGFGDLQNGRSISSKNSELQLDSMSLQEALKNLDVETHVDKNKFVVDFPKNFFGNGDYQIAAEQRKLVDLVLGKIKPFQKDIKIYFEGHTDDRPSHKKMNTLVVDNFLLSSLRASTALLAAKDNGFEEKNMYIQAASSHKRNTRSLSMHVLIENEGRQ